MKNKVKNETRDDFVMTERDKKEALESMFPNDFDGSQLDDAIEDAIERMC